MRLRVRPSVQSGTLTSSDGFAFVSRFCMHESDEVAGQTGRRMRITHADAVNEDATMSSQLAHFPCPAIFKMLSVRLVQVPRRWM
jgi:hypothetical protein